MNQYKIFEDEFASLHMFAWTPDGEIIYAANITYSTGGLLKEFIKDVETMEEEGWDGPRMWSNDKADRIAQRTKYYNDVASDENCRLVADNAGIYKDRMRLRARKAFGLPETGDEKI